MGKAKFAIIMTSSEYWDPHSPCKDEVQAILEKGLKIFNIRVDDTCHKCMRGNFLGDSIDQIDKAEFLKAKLGRLNCFPPPHKPVFQDNFNENAQELLQMLLGAGLPLTLLQPTSIADGDSSIYRL